MLYTAAIVALAGTALGSEPGIERVSLADRMHAISATPVIVGTSGDIVEFGETVNIHTGAARGPGVCQENTPYFDSLGVADTDGDGIFGNLVCGDACGLSTPSSRYLYGTENPLQGYTLDINTDPSPGRLLDSLTIPGSIVRCDQSQAEFMQILVLVYDDIDTSGVGFDSDGDTINDTPFPQDDLDNDGIPDAYLGGVVLTYDAPDSSAGGYTLFLASNLADLGVPLPEDGSGGVQVMFIDGFVDLDGDTVPETPSPFENVAPLFWGPTNTVDGCPFSGSPSSSSGVWWGLGYDVCEDEPGHSPDPYTFVPGEYLVDVVPCVDTLMPAFTLFGTCASGRLCADQNSDGMVLPTDFTAWIANFNANDARADVNQDGSLTPTDFTAWIGAFNQGQAGPVCDP